MKKILIVITDGESHERDRLSSAAQAAEAKHIVRFAIGVSSSILFTVNLLWPIGEKHKVENATFTKIHFRDLYHQAS